MDISELRTDYGFVTDETKNPNVIGEVAPYQFDTALRSDQTLRFYRNLDLESCLWEFETYYDMSELLEECGGVVGTDGQVSTQMTLDGNSYSMHPDPVQAIDSRHFALEGT